MRIKCNRILSALLSVFLLFGAMPFSVSARKADTEKEQTEAYETLAFSEAEASGVNHKKTVSAAESDSGSTETLYDAEDIVRVSIFLDGDSVYDTGYLLEGIAENTDAMAYRASLDEQQTTLAERISETVLDGEALDVVWNLTVAVNCISANVPFGKIDAIRQVAGVSDVVLETTYAPEALQEDTETDRAGLTMATAAETTGTDEVWSAGYTGAGTRIAVIDTGLNIGHQSFDEGAFLYALEEDTEAAESLDLLDTNEIQSVLKQLNAYKRLDSVTAAALYQNAKIPFAFNYIDRNTDVSHANDSQTAHGSHVAGIAAANRYIPLEDGSGYTSADASGFIQGTAPDAQLLVMKVFGADGSATDADFLAAIEDAILLDADTVNLSFGFNEVGFTVNTAYADVYEKLMQEDILLVASCGNAGAWSTNDTNIGYLYGDEVSFDTVSAPGIYESNLAVASIDNISDTAFFAFDGHAVFPNETLYGNTSIATIAGTTYDYILLDSIGEEKDFAAIGKAVLSGKIAICYRGTTTFVSKAEAAVKYGAVATVVINNRTGFINMDLTDYTQKNPCVCLTKAQGQLLKSSAVPVYAKDGKTILYYQGSITIGKTASDYLRMSEDQYVSTFSSWGCTGALTIKPEIVSVGGYIRSVDGDTVSGYKYMTGTSMAAPQVSGMGALLAQYIRKNNLTAKTGLSQSTLMQSLLMSTATPILDANTGLYCSVLAQGTGLASVANAIQADSYIIMDSSATEGAAYGKVKAELGDDPAKTGSYTVSFTLHNLTDKETVYTLSSTWFTQAMFGITDDTGNTTEYLDTATEALNADVRYSVDGKTLSAAPGDATKNCDFDGNGSISEEDGQALLDFIVGKRSKLYASGYADFDKNGKITANDAYAFYTALNKLQLTLPANGECIITASVTLTDAQKKELNRKYAAGAYVEGYIFVSEENGNTEHSIPVLGFYGNWSDASMFEPVSVGAREYGDTTVSHCGITDTNVLKLQYAGTSEYAYQTGNPYVTESKNPISKAAISATTNIVAYDYTLIRNGATLLVIKDGNGNIIDTTAFTAQDASAYYHTTYKIWGNVVDTASIEKTTATLGMREGETVDITLLAVPEYYAENGIFTEDALLKLWQSGKLGSGTALHTKMVIDNTAPQIRGVQKDTNTDTLKISALDNQYIAYIAVMDESEETIYAAVCPEQEKKNTEITVSLTPEDTSAEYYKILVADYAGNESYYRISNGSVSLSDTAFYCFTDTDTTKYSGNRMMCIDTDAESRTNAGKFTAVPFRTMAAEYVGGYVYMAADDGYLYAASIYSMSEIHTVCRYDTVTDTIRDLAYDTKNKILYAIDEQSRIYKVDLISGELLLAATLTLQNNQKAHLLAIDDNGNFYTVNDGTVGTDLYLYRFTLNDCKQTLKPMSADPISSNETITNPSECASSLAWNHNTDELYFYKENAGLSEMLYFKATEDKSSVKSTAVIFVLDVGNQDILNIEPRGLFFIPSGNTAFPVAMSGTPTSIQLTTGDFSVLERTTVALNAYVSPWFAESDVVYESSNTTVATVTENGLVQTYQSGTVTIKAYSAKKPSVSASCRITVKKANAALNALLYDENGDIYWSSFNVNAPSAYTKKKKAVNCNGGIYADGLLYLHNGTKLICLDAVTMQEKETKFTSVKWNGNDGTYISETENGGFGCLVAIAEYGTELELLFPKTGNTVSVKPSGMNLTDCMAVVAFEKLENNDAYLLILTENGTLYRVKLTLDGGSYKATAKSCFRTDLSLNSVATIVGDYNTAYASGYYDAATALFYVALQKNDASGRTRLYAIDVSHQCITQLGDFGADIYPVVCLCRGTGSIVNAAETTEKIPSVTAYADNTEQTEAVSLTGTEQKTDTAVACVSEDAEILTMEITVKDASGKNTDTTNGFFTVSYDPAVLTLLRADVHAAYSSEKKDSGLLTVAYVNPQTMTAGTSVATLLFAKRAKKDISVTTAIRTVDGETVNVSETTVLKELSAVYSDMPEKSHWAYNGILYTLREGMLLPVDGLVKPQADMTRAMLVYALYALEGAPVLKETVSFLDVPEDAWYYQAAVWSQQNGIILGDENGNFMPDVSITREQIAVILYRYAVFKGYSVTAKASVSKYPDHQKVSSWAKEQIAWAVGSKLVNGATDNKGTVILLPQGTATREQVATILLRMVNSFSKT